MPTNSLFTETELNLHSHATSAYIYNERYYAQYALLPHSAPEIETHPSSNQNIVHRQAQS